MYFVPTALPGYELDALGLSPAMPGQAAGVGNLYHCGYGGSALIAGQAAPEVRYISTQAGSSLCLRHCAFLPWAPADRHRKSFSLDEIRMIGIFCSGTEGDPFCSRCHVCMTLPVDALHSQLYGGAGNRGDFQPPSPL